MKEYIKNIIEESLINEVEVDKEWERLLSSINTNKGRKHFIRS